MDNLYRPGIGTIRILHPLEEISHELQPCIVGGLLTDLVLNIGEVFTAFVLRQQYIAAMRLIGREPSASLEALIYSILITFGIGIFAVWLYAAIRPRFGPGVKTAMIAGAATWFIQGSNNLRLASQGLFPPNLVALAGSIVLVEFWLATCLGAWVYNDNYQD